MTIVQAQFKPIGITKTGISSWIYSVRSILRNVRYTVPLRKQNIEYIHIVQTGFTLKMGNSRNTVFLWYQKGRKKQ